MLIIKDIELYIFFFVFTNIFILNNIATILETMATIP